MTRRLLMSMAIFFTLSLPLLSGEGSQTAPQTADTNQDCGWISEEQAEKLLGRKLLKPEPKKTPGAKTGCDYHLDDDSMGFVTYNLYVPAGSVDSTINQMVKSVADAYGGKSEEIPGLGTRTVYVGEEGRFSHLFVSNGINVLDVLFWKIPKEKVETFTKALLTHIH